MAKAVLHWTLVLLTLAVTVIVTFLPVMFGLAEILPHKSSDLPDAMLFWSSVAGSFILGAVAARFVHRRLQRRSSLPGSAAGAYSAMDDDTFRFSLRAPHGARHRGR
jgi:hypothetical protein